MKYHELNTTRNKRGTRVGRGISAGKGKTAGRGTKGQNSRKSGGVRPGFEGGQTPLYKKVPKLRGFKSKKTAPENVYTGQLDSLGVNVTNDTLAEAGLVSNPFVRVKLIVKGDVTKKHTVKLQSASATAIEKVKKAGGTFEEAPQQMRPKKTEKQ